MFDVPKRSEIMLVRDIIQCQKSKTSQNCDPGISNVRGFRDLAVPFPYAPGYSVYDLSRIFPNSRILKPQVKLQWSWPAGYQLDIQLAPETV